MSYSMRSVSLGVLLVLALTVGVAAAVALPETTAACCGDAGGGDGRSGGRDVPLTPVAPKPKPVCEITISPGTVKEGGSATLKWSTQYATSASINQGIGSVAVLSGSKTVNNLVQNTTYTMTVKGVNGTATCKTTVTVKPKPKDPPKCELWAAPEIVTNPWAGTTFIWNAENATSATIDNGVGSVPVGQGWFWFGPIWKSATYTMTVTGPGGSAQCSTKVTVEKVEEDTKPSCWISLDKPMCTEEEGAMLSWGSTNAAGAWLDPEIGFVATEGSQSVYPKQHTKYVLTVWDNDDDVAYCEASLDVKSAY